MSLTGDNTAKFLQANWANCPKILGNHKRRSSSSGLFSINITEPILSRYKQLAKLHSDSSVLGLNAVNKPSLPRGTLFRSSLPATPLTSPMYTSILHQFTERAIQDLLGKSSTPKVIKSTSEYGLELANEPLTPTNKSNQASQNIRTNLFDLPLDSNVITRGSLIRPKTLDIKNKIKLDSNLSKISENGKLEEEIDTITTATTTNNIGEKDKNSLSFYYSIKEEKEEEEIEECKSDRSIDNTGDKTVNGDKSIELKDKIVNNNLEKSNDKTILDNNQTQQVTKTNNSTIILDSSTELSLKNLTINDNNKSKLINDNNKQIEQNGHNNNIKENGIDQQTQNCLFVKNLPNNIANDELRDYFGKLGLNGVITKVYIPKDHNTKIQKNFGFVTFSDLNDVERILSYNKKLNPLKGRHLQVDLAKKR